MNMRRASWSQWLAHSCLLSCLLCWPLTAAADEFNTVLSHNESNVELSVSPDYNAKTRADIQRWIAALSDSLLQVYGRWPKQEWQIIVAPASARGVDPVPWARIHRGPIDRVELYTAPRARFDELMRASTGYHELAHLLIPYRGWGDVWFSEGLASYYQYILQARSGGINETQFWQALHDGFESGRLDSQFRGEALGDIDDRLREEGGYSRIYWSGAWYFLNIDIRLRRQSRGNQTLDTALDALNRCCAEQSLSVAQMVEKLDVLNGVLLFQRMYGKSQRSTAIPSAAPLFASLGIDLIDGKVHLQQVGPGAILRQAIVQPLAL